MNLNQILKDTIREKYAVGSFSPRCARLIAPVLETAQALNSPAIIQISQNEFNWFGVTPEEFAAEYFMQLKKLHITVPTTLHLDHTKDPAVIRAAIDAGFESVMIDASEKELQENIAITQSIVALAHPRGVSVEAELGRIISNDKIETEGDKELYTVPEEALLFVNETGIDALAVSVGTAHGVYKTKAPTIDYGIIKRIKALTPVWLVLHGGSGVPTDIMVNSYMIEGGGISKVNIATDIELAFLTGIGREKRLSNRECNELPDALYEQGATSVHELIRDKIKNYLKSDGKAK